MAKRRPPDRNWMRQQALTLPLDRLMSVLHDCETGYELAIDLDNSYEASYWLARLGVIRLELARRDAAKERTCAR